MLPFSFINPNKKNLFLLYSMIQAFTETNFTAYLSTEDNRIDKSVASTQIRFLVKFINDLDGSVDYSYPSVTINNRYTKMDFSYNSPNPGLYEAQVKLLPAGHWKYEVYEVSWIGSVVVALGTAPANETDILSVADTNGVVQGIVTKGILNLTEKSGTEQVQYSEYNSPEATNYIYFGNEFDPTSLPSMALWYQHLQKLENQDGVTDTSLFIDTDKIKWESQVSSNLLYNDENWNRPIWNIAKKSVDIDGDKYYELASSLVITADFSLCMSVQFKNTPSQDGMYGSGNTNMFEATDANTFTFRAGGVDEITFTSATQTLVNNTWYTVILQRISGVVSVYVDAGDNNIIEWGTGTDTDTLTIDTIGSWNGDFANLDGYIRDISYFTEGLTMSERQHMVAYINNY